jgi:hypothetical protein
MTSRNLVKIILHIAFSATALTLLTFSVFSQSNATLSGSVTDVLGASLPDAKVRLKNISNQDHPQWTETTTDDNGKFYFKNVCPGEYVVSVHHATFNTEMETLITVPNTNQLEIKLELGGGCGRLSDKDGEISEKDKAEVTRLALASAIRKLLPQESAKNRIILSTKNIKPEWFVDWSSLKLELMDQKQIQQKADHEGDFPYIAVSEIKATSTCIAITLNYTWAKKKDSQALHMDEAGTTLEFRKESGKWSGKTVVSWVS